MYFPPSTIGDTTVHVIGKCPVKGCRNRRRNTYPGTVKRNQLHTWTDWKIPADEPYGAVFAHLAKGSDNHRGYGLHPCPSQWLANNPHAFERTWFAAVEAAGWICTDHDRFMVVVEVQGTVNESRACDGRCMGATGPNCECSCGGENHGASWA